MSLSKNLKFESQLRCAGEVPETVFQILLYKLEKKKKGGLIENF